MNLRALILLTISLLQSCDTGIIMTKKKSRGLASTPAFSSKAKEKLSPGTKDWVLAEQKNSNLSDSSFPLPYYLIPAQDITALKANSQDTRINIQLSLLVSGLKYYKFFIHPQSESQFEFLKNAYRYIGTEETEFQAMQAIGARSLIAWDKNALQRKPFLIELSIGKDNPSKNDALIGAQEVEMAMIEQKKFENIGKSALEKMHLKIFPEAVGFMLKSSNKDFSHKWGGQLIREIPDDINDNSKKWLSFATLLSVEKNPPLIMDLIKQSGMSAYNFLDQYMIKGYLDVFQNLSLENGIFFEPSPLNLMLETGQDLKPTDNWIVRNTGNKLQKRGNIFTSYNYFYKKMIFDVMLEQVAKVEGALSAREVQALQEKIDKNHAKAINKYLKLKIKRSLDPETYKKISQTMIEFFDGAPNIPKKLLSETPELSIYINRKKANDEWLEFSQNLDGKRHYYLTDHALYEVSHDATTGVGIFTPEEQEAYKTKEMLPQLMPK